MRNFIYAVLAIALAFTPALALADDPAPGSQFPGPGGQPPPGFQIMEQARAKTQQIHAQARFSTLGALSAQHRNQLSQIIGQLAISPNPDFLAAVKQVDAMLTPAEGKAILSISTSAEAQVRQIMESARQQWETANPPPGGTGGERRNMVFRNAPQLNDPGAMLLEMAAHAIAPQEPGYFGVTKSIQRQ